MSTRWYPLYQKGNPQLRIFLPNFWMKLIAPKTKELPNVVHFHCSMEMTRNDVKNYLEKIYNIKVMFVRTRIAPGKTRPDFRQNNAIIKDDDRKIAYVVLPKDQSFVFPDLFEKGSTVFMKDDEKVKNEAKKDLQDYINKVEVPGTPGWFRI